MKTFILALSLIFSAQMAHAQSCVNEHGAPPTQPNAQEITDGNEFAQIINSTRGSNSFVLVEFYLGGCCWYNGEVSTVNNLIQIYGSNLKVVEVEFSSDAAQIANQNGFFRNHGTGSPQFQLIGDGRVLGVQVGGVNGNALLQWIDGITGFGNSGQFNPSQATNSTCGSTNAGSYNSGSSSFGNSYPSNSSGKRQ